MVDANAIEPGAAVVSRRRLLVVADAFSDEVGLSDEIESRLDGAVAVHVVVPVRVSHLHFLANDESEERRDAERTMRAAVALLRRRGISATGSVGTDRPLETMTDALRAFPATGVLLAVPAAAESYWLERDLAEHARALTDLPITQAIVASRAPEPREARS
jgi:hypothetical protein